MQRSVERLVAGAFKQASRVRGERAIHAKGRAYAARLRLLPGARDLGVPLSEGPDDRPCVVRFSRGAGVPDALPDVIGFALRVPDADGAGGCQDVLLATTGSAPGLRHLLRPTRHPYTAAYSSITTFDVGGRSLVVGARPLSRPPADGLSGGAFELLTATLSGPWAPFAEVHVGAPLSDEESRELAFDVRNGAGGLRPNGPFRGMRERAYPAARSVEE